MKVNLRAEIIKSRSEDQEQGPLIEQLCHQLLEEVGRLGLQLLGEADLLGLRRVEEVDHHMQ